MSVTRRTSSATLEFPEDTLVMVSFNFLSTRKPAPACPLLASESYRRWPLWRVVKLTLLIFSTNCEYASSEREEV